MISSRVILAVLLTGIGASLLFAAFFAVSHAFVSPQKRFQRIRLLIGFALPVVVGNLAVGRLFARWEWSGEVFRWERLGLSFSWMLLYLFLAAGCLRWVSWMSEELAMPSDREVSKRWIGLVGRLAVGLLIAGILGIGSLFYGNPLPWDALALVGLLCAFSEKIALFFMELFRGGL